MEAKDHQAAPALLPADGCTSARVALTPSPAESVDFLRYSASASNQVPGGAIACSTRRYAQMSAGELMAALDVELSVRLPGRRFAAVVTDSADGSP